MRYTRTAATTPLDTLTGSRAAAPLSKPPNGRVWALFQHSLYNDLARGIDRRPRDETPSTCEAAYTDCLRQAGEQPEEAA